MRRVLVLTISVATALVVTGPAAAAGTSSMAALQVALRAHGLYPAEIDGVPGPLTSTGLTSLQRSKGLTPTGQVGPATRTALGSLGRPLLGQRELGVGAVGWDVSSLEFKLVGYGLSAKAVDGRFTAATAAALARFQAKQGLTADGIAGARTFSALARHAGGRGASGKQSFTPSVRETHAVQSGESFYSISERYHTSPLLLAKASGLTLAAVIVPGQKLTLPAGISARSVASDSGAMGQASADAVRSSLDRWSAAY